MGLQVYRSNRLEALVALLAERLREVPADPCEALEIVVGSRGMERHLRHALAEHLGICAHVDFPFPAAALDKLVPDRAAGPDPWAPSALTWALLEVLPAVVEGPDGAALGRYLQPSQGGAVDARTWGLCCRIADTFDRYVTFRPEIASAWSEGRPAEVPEAQRWQPALWQAVRAHLGDPPHRAERLARLAEVPEGEPKPPLHVFGLSSLAGSWLTALGHVARHRAVELYLLCPSPLYWADLKRRIVEIPEVSAAPRDEIGERLRGEGGLDRLGDAGHPLLLSWGRAGRDLQILLESLPDGFEDGRTDLFVLPDPDALDRRALHVLQADILDAIHPAQREDFAERELDPDDRSVQIHACHGPTRQVEVLRTVILGMLDADPTLQPRDIVVMTPDIDGYAPLIAAVFDEGQPGSGSDGWSPAGSPRLPWELADLAIRRLNPVADAVLRALDMVDGRASASEVLDLLALPPVAARFDVGPDDVATLRSWVIDSGVRWGVDARHRSGHDQPEDAQNTWRFGLDRLLLGVVMADDGRLPAGIRPFDAVEGGGTRLIGKLAELCASLFQQLDALRAPRPLAAWVSGLDALVTALTHTTGHTAWLTRRVRDELVSLGQEEASSRSTRAIGVDAVRTALSGRFEVASAARHGAGGAITFCGMVPERAVPYRVVCLLGMDEGSFPRTGGRAAFDLTSQAPRIGDRDVRDEDRYLLLEAILSARDHLVVLYTGRDVHDNAVRPPAVPVAELRDALDASWPPGEEAPSAVLTIDHTLQAFDVRNFLGDEPFSYDASLLAGVRAGLGRRQAPTPFLSFEPSVHPAAEAADDLPLDDLVHFWRHPVRSFLQRRLRLWLARDGEEDVPDREPLELGWLDHKLLLDAVMAAHLDGSDPDDIRRALRASGHLPLGGAGEVAFEAVQALAGAMRAEAAKICGWDPGGLREVDLDLPVGGARIVGRLTGCTDAALVVFSYGGEREADLLEAWIRLVAWGAQEPDAPGRAVIVFGKLTSDGGSEVKPIGVELGDDDALSALVDWRREGLARPIPFLAKTSYALAKALLGKKGLPLEWQDPDRLALGGYDDVSEAVDGAVAAARGVWVGGFTPGESDERYHRHAFGGAVPFLDGSGAVYPEFVSLAVRVWGPVLRGRRLGKQMNGWEVA